MFPSIVTLDEYSQALPTIVDSRIAIISLYYQVRGNHSHYTKVIAPPNMLRARELLKSMTD